MSKEEKYQDWFPQKMRLDGKQTVPTIRERDVWWCQLGVNVGYEIFGHGEAFTRPVLIFRKFSRFTFLAAPLSTAEARFDFHIPIKISGRAGIVRLDQMRTLDARRLVGSARMAQLSPNKFEEVRKYFLNSIVPK